MNSQHEQYRQAVKPHKLPVNWRQLLVIAMAILAVAAAIQVSSGTGRDRLPSLGEVFPSHREDWRPRSLFSIADSLTRPMAVAISTSGEIFVADADCKCIRVFGPDGILAYSIEENGDRFDVPVGLAFDRNGTLWVSDLGAGKLFKVNDRRVTGEFDGLGDYDAIGTPAGILISGDTLFVNDLAVHRVLKFDLAQRRYLDDLGIDSDHDLRSMAYPNWSMPLPGGDVLVSDSNNNRLIRFDAESGTPSLWGGEMLLPRGIAIDGENRVHITAALGRHVQTMTTDGSYVGTYTSFVGGEDFQVPISIAIAENRIFVTDQATGLLHVGEWK